MNIYHKVNDYRCSLFPHSLPGKTFSALQLLAWMYTGFQELEPGIDTGLDFAKEHEMASGKK
jgi:hypothetical protein